MLKVSILIPVYNSEKFITETILSAINQTYPNTEVVIVDDGSTDNSFQLAKQFESGKIKVYQQSNKGASSARNLAFKNSTGELIQYLDADDFLHPDKIKFQVDKYIKSTDSNAVMSCIWGRFEKKIDNIKWEKQAIDKDYIHPINWLIDSWGGKGMAAVHSWLVPRHIIKKAGLWDESLSLNDDGEFFCRVLLNSSIIKHVPESKVYYRSNISLSLSQSRSSKAIHSELKSYKSYRINSLKQADTTKLRKALGQNFLNFTYMYYTQNRKLAKEALNEFYKLKIGKPWPVGSIRFKQLANCIGFKNVLKLKNIFIK
jgi:glycosyltransferase involved in cell wall biosynthesis